MLRNQATALLRHEHLTTTVPRAKELRPFVERLITIAKRGLATDGSKKAKASDNRALNARRHVMQSLQDEDVVRKLFDTLAPRFEARPGGYTRLLRLGFRKGDAAEVAQVELVGSEYNPRAKAEAEAKETETEAPKKPKGVGGRLRAAADRLRGKKEEASGEEKATKRVSTKGAGGAKPRPKKQGPRGS
jgi:large subunit ribosomal protein L17